MDLETIRDLYAVTGLESPAIEVSVYPDDDLAVALWMPTDPADRRWVWSLDEDHVSQERVAAVLSAAAECWLAGSPVIWYDDRAGTVTLTRLLDRTELTVAGSGPKVFPREAPAAVEAWLYAAAERAGLPEGPPAPALNRSLPAALDELHRSLGITESPRFGEVMMSGQLGTSLRMSSFELDARYGGPHGQELDLARVLCERADRLGPIVLYPVRGDRRAGVYAEATDTPGQLAVKVSQGGVITPAARLSTEQVVAVVQQLVHGLPTGWSAAPDLELSPTTTPDL